MGEQWLGRRGSQCLGGLTSGGLKVQAVPDSLGLACVVKPGSKARTHSQYSHAREGKQAAEYKQVLHKRRLSYTNQVRAVRQLVHSKVSTRPFVPLGCYVLEHAPALGLPLLLPATCNRCWRRRTIALATLFLYFSVPACAIAACWKSRRSSTDGRPPSWDSPPAPVIRGIVHALQRDSLLVRER